MKQFAKDKANWKSVSEVFGNDEAFQWRFNVQHQIVFVLRSNK
jgi:hypothetical protein